MSDTSLHYDILSSDRQAIIPLFSSLSDLGYYLAGGTALALQLGHRDSIDFDFFCPEPYDTILLFETLRHIFIGHTLIRMQEESNTLELIVDNSIRLSFMTYQYPLVMPLIKTDFFDLASLIDIGCMKLSAITSRTAYKDYVDLYFILKETSLAILMEQLQTKLPTLDPLLSLKSLIYFDDIKPEEILYKTIPQNMATIQADLTAKVRDYSSQ